MSLQCRLDDAKLPELERQYSRTAVWSGSPSAAEENNALPVSWIAATFDDGMPFSDDNTIYLFFCRSSQNSGDRDFLWNHGIYSIAVMNHKEKTVLWQYEQW